MKKISFEQMIIGLDDLFFGKTLQSVQEATDRADLIEAYLEVTGYSWNDIIDHLLAEELPYDQAQEISTRLGRSGLS